MNIETPWLYPNDSNPIAAITLTSNGQLYRIEHLKTKYVTHVKRELVEDPNALFMVAGDFPRDLKSAFDAFRRQFE